MSTYNLNHINPHELHAALELESLRGSPLFRLPTNFESAYQLYLVEHRFSTILARVSGVDSACFELCEADLKHVTLGTALLAWLKPLDPEEAPPKYRFLAVGLAWQVHPSAFLIATQDLLGLKRVDLESGYPEAARTEALRCARLLFPGQEPLADILT